MKVKKKKKKKTFRMKSKYCWKSINKNRVFTSFILYMHFNKVDIWSLILSMVVCPFNLILIDIRKHWSPPCFLFGYEINLMKISTKDMWQFENRRKAKLSWMFSLFFTEKTGGICVKHLSTSPVQITFRNKKQ